MLNKWVGMGRLTKNPEMRYTQQNTPVASFTVAVDRDFGEKQTDFIDCTAWNKTAEFISKYFQKGQMISVSGRLQSRKWEDKNGNNRINWEIVVDQAYFCGDKKSDTYRAGNVSASDFEELGDDGSELPF